MMKLNTEPSKARWYVSIIMGRDLMSDSGDGRVIGTDTWEFDGYSGRVSAPAVMEVLNGRMTNDAYPLEVTITSTQTGEVFEHATFTHKPTDGRIVRLASYETAGV